MSFSALVIPEDATNNGYILGPLPDADGKADSRKAELRALEDDANRQGARLLCCAAEQESEVWLLAGHRQHLKQMRQSWREIRADSSVKENVFELSSWLMVIPRLQVAGENL